jgi:uncharacterized membrane protein YfcA
MPDAEPLPGVDPLPGADPTPGGDLRPAPAADVEAAHGSPWWLRAAGIGVAAGLLSGLFGVGGGIIMVPLLVAWFALDQRRASATSLLAIVPIATASAIGYARNGNVDLAAGLLLLVGGVVGGQLGARLLPRTPIATLQLWFGILSLATAARLVIGGSSSALSGLGAVWEGGLLVLVGVAAGTLAGLLGVGGGIIMVPGLVILTGDDADTARGTSLLVVIFTALTATVTNLRNGLVEVRPALVAGLVGAPAGLVGAAVGQWLPERIALILFGGLLVWSGVQMILRSRRSRRAASSAPGRDT